jgi:hypothetical protein
MFYVFIKFSIYLHYFVCVCVDFCFTDYNENVFFIKICMYVGCKYVYLCGEESNIKIKI